MVGCCDGTSDTDDEVLEDVGVAADAGTATAASRPAAAKNSLDLMVTELCGDGSTTIDGDEKKTTVVSVSV